MKNRLRVCFAWVAICCFLSGALAFSIMSGEFNAQGIKKVIDVSQDNKMKALVFVAIVVVLILFLIDSSIKKMINPFSQINKSIKEKVINQNSNVLDFGGESYSEIQWVINYFNIIEKQYFEKQEEFEKKSAQLEAIICSSNNGIVLLDEEFKVVLINLKAKNLLDFWRNFEIESENQSILQFYKEPKFEKQLLNCAKTHEKTKLQIKNKNRVCSVSIVPRFLAKNKEKGIYVVNIVDQTKLIKLEKSRSDFAVNVTHELRTPLTSISGFAELICSGMIQDVSLIKNYTERILEESYRLRALVEGILKLSQIETNFVENGEKEIVNVRSEINYALDVLDTQLSEKKIETTLLGDVKIFATKQDVQELVFNLVDNAIKYNYAQLNDVKKQNYINIELFANQKACGFSIQNSGKEIATKEINRIFERFYRVERGRERKTGGTGLGLSIVKHIVQRYEGDISVLSENNETKFTVKFPINIVRF